MKKCANCNHDNQDDAVNCESCTTAAFVGSSPGIYGGHIITPAEARFWERMTFRQFAILFVRMQAIWFFFYAIFDATYLPRYLSFSPFGIYASFNSLSSTGQLELFLMIVRVLMYAAAGVACIQFADRILSWLVKDSIPHLPPDTSSETSAKL